MLETVREFAAAHRADSGETERVNGRFLAWARDFGVAHHDSVITGDDLLAFELIRAEQDNLVQACCATGSTSADAGTVAAGPAVLGALWMVESSFGRLIALAEDTARLLPAFRPEPALAEATRTSLVLGAVSGFLLRGRTRRLVPGRDCVGCLPPAPPDTFAPRGRAGRCERR